MLSIKKLSGVHVDSALPVLPIDGEEVKIARIPGWNWFITPHKAFLDPSTKQITERVNGVKMTPSSTSGDTLHLGTLADGNPSFEMGMGETAGTYYLGLPYAGEEFTFFSIVKAYSDLSSLAGSVVLLSRASAATVDSDKLFPVIQIAASGIEVRSMLSSGSSTNISDTTHPASYTAGKLVYLMATYSVDRGFSLFVDGALAAEDASPSGRPIDPDTAPSFGFSSMLRASIGATGVLDIDMSKPVNAGYRAALDAWVLNKFTLGNLA